MAAVDHDVLAYASLRQRLLALFNVSLIEIGPWLPPRSTTCA